MTAARTLAAILSVDVVGYSRLMGEDKAGQGSQPGQPQSGMRAVTCTKSKKPCIPWRDRTLARPGAYLQATAGSQRHFSLVKGSLLPQSQPP